jgi:hypothetical protein
MKACLIPPRGLEGYALHSRFHLALALPELMRNTDYVTTYQRAARGNDYTILDNGEAEGARVSAKELFEAAQLIGASEIVLPDVIGEVDDTTKRTRGFLVRYEEELGPYNLMGVAQGKNEAELQKCIEYYSKYAAITTIGIPRHIIRRMDKSTARVDLANWIKAEFENRFTIHLLGVDPYRLREIAWAAKYASHVRSIDSSLPFNYALMSAHLNNGAPAITRPGRYFEKNWATVVTRDLVLANIGVFKGWANDTESGSGSRRGRVPEASGSGVREVPAVQFVDEVRTESGSAES